MVLAQSRELMNAWNKMWSVSHKPNRLSVVLHHPLEWDTKSLIEVG